MMFRKLTLTAVAAMAFLSVTSVGAQNYQVAQDASSGPLPPGYGRQAPPPPQGNQQPQQRQRYQQPPVQAQQPYERGFDRGGRDRGYERRPRYGYDEPAPYRQRGRFGDYCATSRGACETRPQPVGTSCRCYIDGLTKRGIIQ